MNEVFIIQSQLIAVKIVKTPGNSYICGQFDSYENVFLFIQNKISVYKRIVNCVTKNQPCVKRNHINVTKKGFIDYICPISPMQRILHITEFTTY